MTDDFSLFGADRHQHPETRHQRHERRTALADQGQWYTNNRQQARHHPHIDEDVNEEGKRYAAGQQALFGERFLVGGRNDRMGVQLDGIRLRSQSAGDLDSRPVFPGTVQCPESGQPFVLGVDAQTTGGYPRVAEVIRADRSQLGQLRSGAALHLLKRDAETAARELKALHAFWSDWLPGIDALL